MSTNLAHPAHPRDQDDLHRTVPADGVAAAQMMREVRSWMSRWLVLDDQRYADIALATYEALANCADHAYRTHGRAGQMTVHVSYDEDTSTVQICVQDQGRWINPDSQPSTRGRGLLLMRALADGVSVNGRDDGTTICLHFESCPRRDRSGHQDLATATEKL